MATWNIAAINNNPFEYWITHDDADYNAFHDCASSALLDPELAGDACRFSLLTAHWLTRMARVPDEEARK